MATKLDYTTIKISTRTRNRIKAIAAERQWFLEDTINTALNQWADLVDLGHIGADSTPITRKGG